MSAAWAIHYRQAYAVAYFKGNVLLHQNAIFDVRSSSLKSGYRFLQTIYRLPDIV